MQVHNLIQGSPEWDQFRLEHNGASEAAAMLGLSPKVKRTELLHAKKTGIAREFSAWVREKILDPGHEMEAAARPIVEEIIGEELSPVTCSEGKESASCDGLTLEGHIAMEHKRWNTAHAALVEAGQVPEEHMPQCQQVLMVTGAEKLIFVMSDGTRENMVYVWVLPDQAWFKRLRAGWAQFAEDLAAYVPSTAPAVEKLIAEPVESLPAPAVQVSGQIALVDNFKPFEQRLREFLATKLIREPKTDEDFVNLDAQIKSMKSWREALKGAKAQMLAQVQPIDQASKTADMLDTLLQQNCAMAERLLKDEKERRRTEIVTGGQAALQQHVAALNTRLGKPYVPAALASADFGGAIKGMRSLASMEDAVSSLLANSKIAANETADRIGLNLATLREKAAAHAFLFADTPQLVLKQPDDLAAIVSSRIAEHEAKEAQRMADERARIQAEERQRAEAAAAADAKRQADEAAAKARAEERARIEQEQAAAAAARAAEEAQRPVAVAAPAVTTAPAPAVLQMPVRAAAPAAAPLTKPTLRLGVINERLLACGISTTADGLRLLGFQPAEKDRSALLYHERDWPHMLAAIVQRIEAMTATAAA